MRTKIFTLVGLLVAATLTSGCFGKVEEAPDAPPADADHIQMARHYLGECDRLVPSGYESGTGSCAAVSAHLAAADWEERHPDQKI